MKVLKFGGTSLGTPERVQTVVDIIREKASSDAVAIVASAFGGVTDSLAKASQWSVVRDPRWETVCDELETRHVAAVSALALDEERPALEARARTYMQELRELLHGVSLVRECTQRTLDQLQSYGERLSAAVLATALRRSGVPAQDCDARQFITTDKHFGAAQVLRDKTEKNIREYFREHTDIQVVTGFIGATADGETTTLGRGGSDLTAALIGAALGVDVIEIWTDVDGVMSADPRLVPSAFPLPHLSYEELMELCHFGAKVVFPPTVHPARRAAIPLIIKNTLNPSFAGTRIAETAESSQHPIRGISSINRVSLLRLEGDGMVGVPGTAMRLFEALAKEDISIILISQASSEHSICLAVPPECVNRARSSVEKEFALERRAGIVDELVVENELSVIAVVGEAMRERPGISGRLFSVLGDRGVNVRAIAQGSSELNISLVIAREDEAKALIAIHDAFFSSGVHVFIAGTGRVGGVLRTQLHSRASVLSKTLGLPLKVTGVCNIHHMLLDRRGLAANSEVGESGSLANDLDEFVKYVEATPDRRVFVDCTASATVAEYYPRLLRGHTAVVTANKLSFADSQERFEALMEACWTGGRGLYFETTVGAGLPIVRTLRDLVETGDEVTSIEGVFSGTLSFLCHEISQGGRFSEVLKQAHAAGYTEPDPREDLGGHDVARKLLILARQSGLALEPSDVEVSPFLRDDRLNSLPLDGFWEEVVQYDEKVAADRDSAQAEGKVLCYLARLEDGRARVGLEAVDQNHPCANLSGTDNVFVFKTRRYHDTPLVVQGPGAGPEVTAAGVFGDVLRAAAESPCSGTR